MFLTCDVLRADDANLFGKQRLGGLRATISIGPPRPGCEPAAKSAAVNTRIRMKIGELVGSGSIAPALFIMLSKAYPRTELQVSGVLRNRSDGQPDSPAGPGPWRSKAPGGDWRNSDQKVSKDVPDSAQLRSPPEPGLLPQLASAAASSVALADHAPAIAELVGSQPVQAPKSQPALEPAPKSTPPAPPTSAMRPGRAPLEQRIASLQATPPTSWSVSQVCDWLEACHMGQYRKRFVHHAVSGPVLLGLTDERLRVDLLVGK